MFGITEFLPTDSEDDAFVILNTLFIFSTANLHTAKISDFILLISQGLPLTLILLLNTQALFSWREDGLSQGRSCNDLQS